MNVHNKALIAPVVAVLAFMLSPDFYNLLPDKYAHLIATLAVIASALMPQLFKKEDKGEK